ncbi:MAG TPA: bifunctional phosphoribosylaminoimidazolecarboxamide formyltransferase/IMP cyclohydrolase PurH [Elusimicrobia bacterium]|nr:bifunctional phosphoribosylaminoimidazolecarboxamide formyltransferase/IMP cyclohydrolase PurH [Elusimicrobiota bacterium]HBT62605.1 bifunctional phosphoribosylaminoimidazolecarboxamide formyltransferase/IMP cyclohydrolase PurH [Elusimicrobiota bacterium]
MTHKTERYALLHVADRTGIVELAWALKDLGFTLIADGGTAAALRQAELEVKDLKTLLRLRADPDPDVGLAHPEILYGLSAGHEPGSIGETQKRRGLAIDLVAVNLYPLAEIVDSDLPQSETLKTVDLAASALLRAAGRNFRHVVCLCDPGDYQPVVDSLRQHDDLGLERRQQLAAKAFHYCAYYDSTVAQYLGSRWDRLPREFVIGLRKTADLRYGENIHQHGALYAWSGARPWGMSEARTLYGEPLLFNHYFDLDAAWELAGGFPEPACAIVKHGVPAGVAIFESLAEAARLAYRSDARGCFRGTAAVNREVDEEAAAFFAAEALSCIAAPAFTAKALLALKVKKDIRLVTLPSTLISAHELEFRSVAGGALAQDKDHQALPGSLKIATRRAPTQIEMNSLRLAWRVAKHSRTHAAVLCRGGATLGIGSGQTSRLDAVRLALTKSRDRHPILSEDPPVVMASDGALSVDHVLEAARHGVKAVIQSGFSSEDDEAISACDGHNLAMVFTGVRHFRH